MENILAILDDELNKALEKADLLDLVEGDGGFVRFSDRPDLSDFQCNTAMTLAKKAKKNPREIAQKIADALRDSPYFSSISVDGPGFINLSVNSNLLSEYMNSLIKDERLCCPKTDNPRNVVVDFCGANIAKPLHVGHLRASIIGECLKRLFRFNGDNVTGDIHLGDWGRPMGLLIAEIEERQPDLVYFDPNYQGEYPEESPVTVEDLGELYPSASQHAKDDKVFLEKARQKTQELQDGRRGYRALWQHFIDISITDLKPILDKLGVSFDLWNGESTVHEETKAMIQRFKDEKIAELSEGAYIIRLDDDESEKELPPLIIEKSDGAILYGSTDMATIEDRVKNLNADLILYVVDGRQSLHFEQVFKASKKTGIAGNAELEHIKFGTVNGPDGKPFKTRDGGVMKLSDLIVMATEEVKKLLKDRPLGEQSLEETAEKIGVAAIKFADLINNREADYIFDIKKFSSFEGKTGPYILYSMVRIKSILEKAKERGLDKFAKQEILPPTHESEKKLIFCLTRLPLAIEAAYQSRKPHVLCEFAFDLAQSFSAFYGNCQILNNEDKQQSYSYLQLVTLVYKELKLLMDIIGIETVDKM